jgi:hypothetical protein
LVMQGIGDLAAQVGAADAATREDAVERCVRRVDPHAVSGDGRHPLPAGGRRAVLAAARYRGRKRSNAAASDECASIAASSRIRMCGSARLCIFVYVGAEVMAGDAIGTYGNGFGLPLDDTKFFTSFTLAAMLVGYIVGLIVIPRFVSQQRLPEFSAVLGRAAGDRRVFTDRLCVGRFRRRAGLRQRDDVAGDLPARDPGLGAHTERRLGAADHGHRGGAIVPQLFAG